MGRSPKGVRVYGTLSPLGTDDDMRCGLAHAKRGPTVAKSPPAGTKGASTRTAKPSISLIGPLRTISATNFSGQTVIRLRWLPVNRPASRDAGRKQGQTSTAAGGGTCRLPAYTVIPTTLPNAPRPPCSRTSVTRGKGR